MAEETKQATCPTCGQPGHIVNGIEFYGCGLVIDKGRQVFPCGVSEESEDKGYVGSQLPTSPLRK